MTTTEQKEEQQTMLEKVSNNNGPAFNESRLPEDQTSLNPDTNNFHHRPECNRNNVRDEDSDMECGLGPFAPNYLQKFASKQAFLIVFCIAWVIQGMYHTYFVSAITTIEKLFQIQSKITGIIMSATEIGQIGSSLLLTYYGGQGHRPKWIAWSMVLFAVSSFTCSLPHFIYGKQLINSNDLTGLPKDPNVCKAYNPLDNITSVVNSSIYEDLAFPAARALETSMTNIVLAIFFISLLGVGMGQTAVYTLGIPYIDDNVASKESPLYFGKLFFQHRLILYLNHRVITHRHASTAKWYFSRVSI